MRSLHLALRIGLVAVLFASTQGFLFTQGLFLLRQDAIAAQFCQNRFVPESTCAGACFLNERLLEHQERERQEKGSVLEAATSIASLLPATAVVPAAIGASPPAQGMWPEGILAGGHRRGVFHPPRG